MQHRILIVGCGNMGTALVKGLSTARERFAVRVHDVHPQRLADLAATASVEAVSDLSASTIEDEAIFLCVKPQDLSAVAAHLRGRIPRRTVVVSILAGVTIAELEKELGLEGGIVRAMPNIAATIFQAATAMAASQLVDDAQKSLVEAVFGQVGSFDWIKEGLLDAVTGLSGSGPAYVYMVIEALTDGGVKMGIPRAVAARLATQTVLGSAMLVKETGLHPAILRDQVTTPGGTTINAIHELEDRGLRAMLISAVETATQRAAHLRKK